MNAGFEACGICIEVDANAPWRQAACCSDADDACIAFDKGQLIEFSEIVHLSDQQLSEPRCDNTVAVVVIHFGSVEQGL